MVLVVLLLLGYSLGAVILALMWRFKHLKIALIGWAILLGPDLVERAAMSLHSVDFRYILDGGKVDVANRGPIAFTEEYRHNPYGGRNYDIRTTVAGADGPQEIGFSVNGVGKPGGGYDFLACPTDPAQFGLRKITGRAEGKFCPVDRNSIYYVSSPKDGPVVLIGTLVGAGNSDLHSMDIRHNGMAIRVAMWRTPLADWMAVRDHVIAILDQSFTPLPKT